MSQADDCSDDDISLPNVQMSAATEALLADTYLPSAPLNDEPGREHASNALYHTTRPRVENPTTDEQYWGPPSIAVTWATSLQVRPKRMPRRALSPSRVANSPTTGEGIANRAFEFYNEPEMTWPPCIERDERVGAGKFATSPLPEAAELEPSVQRRSGEGSPARAYDDTATNDGPPVTRRMSLPLQQKSTTTNSSSRNPPSPARSPSPTATPITRRVRIPPAPSKRKKARRFLVNGDSYTIVRKLGKGGSGRVYEVLSETNEPWALKTIPLADMDALAKAQVENEVALLQKLSRANRVMYLKDWAVNEARKCLYIVMQLGHCDLDNILKDQIERNPKLDSLFVGYYWLEVLKCVALVHSLDVVHSDIKPANFVLASGILKLVDFGIANALPDDTVNIYQDHQAGTPSYMAPETLKALSTGRHAHSSRAVRFGKPSDIWSLGCVLYQMVYGQHPFGHIKGLGPRVLAISDPDHIIEYDTEGIGGVRVPSSYIRTMKACLSRDPAKRPTAEGLMRNVDGLLGAHGVDGAADVPSWAMEAILSSATHQAGTRPSPEDIDSWTERVMDHLEKNAR